ncbi:aryl-alcohol dehydrogenase-like predicted oxidoreductase [Rhizobium sp. BK313]|uniref:aldo/keto reductase n=1 Tax=Rhizobium sp. BK313 TaxID=2587081 RepID=UPI00105D3BB2|nr:aldo/keto reductase [Rhizobium sp. BK313]MBB3459414.1 aryl-alcohol dehydrogenase-like predicted oxidoreductase [Rhizobium sp. BK313]
MHYTNLGRTGLKVSRFVIGGAHFGQTLSQQELDAIVHAGWDAGVTTFYTGDDYNVGEGERMLGEAIKSRRDDLVLMVKAGYRVGAYGNYSRQGKPIDIKEDYVAQRTGNLDDYKLWHAGVAPTARGLNRKHMIQALDGSLKRLQTDYIDVYMAHFFDQTTPLEETMDVLDGFVRAGKVRYLGCAQFNAWQFVRSLWISDKRALQRFEALQLNFSMLDRGVQGEVLPALRDTGASFFAAITDAGGMLTGHYDRNSERPSGEGARQRYIDPFWNDEAFAAMEKIRACAKELGRAPLELAQAWALAQKPVASLWIGPHAPEEIATQTKVTEHPLTADELTVVNNVLASIPASVRR